VERSVLIAATFAAAALLSVGFSDPPAAIHAAGRAATVATASSSLLRILGAGWYVLSPAAKTIEKR
jgi:hypothetical protein